MQDADVATVADGSASLLRLVQQACTSMLTQSKLFDPADIRLAVKNLNLPARFDLLNSGKGDLPGEAAHSSPCSLTISWGGRSLLQHQSRPFKVLRRSQNVRHISQKIRALSNTLKLMAWPRQTGSVCLQGGATHTGLSAPLDARVLSLHVQRC